MTIDKTDSNSVLPAAIQSYSAALVAPARSVHAKAGPVSRPAAPHAAMPSGAMTASDAAATVSFVYYGLTTTDLAYDTTQYPASGTFTGVTPPWLNDLSAVPADWQWTDQDNADMSARGAQVNIEVPYINANVPGQTYAGTTTAQIVQQWYTQGMWTTDTTVFAASQIATLTQNWIADDGEFARQRLGGANPNVLKLAAAGTYDIAGWIGKAQNAASLGALQSTLTAAQSAGTLFVCDYVHVLGPAVTKKLVVNGRFLAAPICFFTIDSATNTLKPAAIQITATDSSSYIFTPGDAADPKGDAWLLAKLWVASADQQWWFSGSHLFNTHSIDMIFGISALNQIQTGALATTHPMLILAKPFLVKSFNINNLVISAPASAEQGIYQKGSFCDAVLPTGRVGLYQIINDLYEGYKFDTNAFSAQMKGRGLESGPIAKVTFPFRDDGQVWWNALQTFVGQIVDASYANDAAVAADAGLNAWLGMVQSAFNHDGKTRFTWTPTVAYLKSAFTNLLFTCSVQHTAVNDTMFNGWAFTPNGPFAMQAAPPANAASVTQAVVLGSLPNPQNKDALVNVIQNQIVFVMNGTAVVSETLGVGSSSSAGMLALYPYAAGSRQQAAVTSFWNAIWTGDSSVSAQISAHQTARIASWKGGTPVPNSLAYYYLSAGLSPWAAPQYLNAPATNAIQI